MIELVEVKCKECGGKGTRQVVLPESLKQARIAAGISMRSLAKRLGFTAPYLSDIENGRRRCTFEIEEAYTMLKPKKERK